MRHLHSTKVYSTGYAVGRVMQFEGLLSEGLCCLKEVRGFPHFFYLSSSRGVGRVMQFEGDGVGRGYAVRRACCRKGLCSSKGMLSEALCSSKGECCRKGYAV